MSFPDSDTLLLNNIEWLCKLCNSQNEHKSKICLQCGTIRDTTKYWQCGNCLLILENEQEQCLGCGACKGQKLQLAPIAVILNHNRNNTVTEIALAEHNQQQRDHFERAQDIIAQLETTILLMNGEFIEKQLSNNNAQIVTTLIDIMNELADFLNKNNQELRQDMKAAIECQTYQPSLDVVKANSVRDKMWSNLNLCVQEFCALGNKFLEIRDGFISVLVELTWHPESLTINQKAVTQLKQIAHDYAMIQAVDVDEQDVKYNDDDDDSKKCLTYLAETRTLLCGSVLYQSVCDSLPAKQDALNSQVEQLNKQIQDYNARVRQKKNAIKSEIDRYNQQVKLRDEYHAKHISAHNHMQYELSNGYRKKFQLIEAQFASCIARIDAHKTNAARYTNRFDATEKQLRKEIEIKRRDFRQAYSQRQELRMTTGIHKDILALKFLQNIEALNPFALRIVARMGCFKILLATLSELIVRSARSGGTEAEMTIEWYFKQPQIHLDGLVTFFTVHKHVHYVKDLTAFAAAFKNKLLPEMEAYLNRKLKMNEKRKIRKLCNGLGRKT